LLSQDGNGVLRLAVAGGAIPRLDDIRLADGADISYHAGLTRSPLTSPITFTPGPRIGPG
jgi:hypothetical protein